MCGITAISSHCNTVSFLLESLEKLEYRGYDSSGVTIITNNKLKSIKRKGKIEVLKKAVNKQKEYSLIGIGHTRWATHGEPSDLNAHPHMNKEETFSIVHNGIIENYRSLKKELQKEGYLFNSQTDSEVIVHLIDKFYNEEPNLLKALKKTTKILEGSYAIALISSYYPDQIFLTRKDSPIVIGHSDLGFFATSDIPTLMNYASDIYFLDDYEFTIMTKDKITFYNKDLNLINKASKQVDFVQSTISKEHFDSFMQKEIFEQPSALIDTITFNDLTLQLKDLNHKLKNFNKIYLVACGTAYHACLSGAYYIEKLAKKTAIVQVASEFRYADHFIDNQTLCIFVSQSGETADTLAALNLAKEKKATTLVIANVIGSSLTRKSDFNLYTKAGTEIAVASTKAYTTQVILLLLFAIHYAKETSQNIPENLMDDIKTLSSTITNILNDESLFKEYSNLLDYKKDAYFLGRSLDYYGALEGALKLKEISYINANAYIAGELKHGPIALIEEGTIVFAIASQPQIITKTISNVQEVISRGAQVVLFSTDSSLANDYQYFYLLPKVNPLLQPIVSIIPLQLIAYYTTLKRGLNIDKPRNLAKSVTVE